MDVPLTIWRNREWIQQFTIQNADGTPVSLLGDTLALVVLRNGSVALSNITPSVDVATAQIVFLFSDGQTALLVPSATLDIAEGTYTWQFIRRAANNPNSDLLSAGPLTVNDSPPFPPMATPQ